jgi:hypothetical protein
MTAGRVSVVAFALAVAIAGCGGSTAQRMPDLSALPLVDGAKIVVRVKQCDPGANSFCAYELIVVARRYKTSDALLESEHRRLLALGWSGATPEMSALAPGIPGERAAESPGHRLRVNYGTAFGDLAGIELGLIKRPPTIATALSRVVFDRSSAMSMQLEVGSH